MEIQHRVLGGHSCGPGQKKLSICLTQMFTAHTVGALNVSCLMHLKPKLGDTASGRW